MRAARARALALLVVLAPVAPGVVQASPLDLFGLGPRGEAMSAVVADVRGAEAVHANPAGVALADRAEGLSAYSYHHFALELDGRDAQVLDAHGVTLGLAIPLWRAPVIALGVALHLPDDFLARIQLIPASEPHFVLLDNPHRIEVDPVLAFRPTPWLAIGAGAHILADAIGGITFNVGVVGGEQVGESAIDLVMPTRAAPVGGVIVTPIPRLRIGASARGALDLRLGLDIVANVDAAAVSGDAVISVRSSSYYTPAKVAAGIAYDVTPDLTVAADAAWNAWSHLRGGLPDVRVLVELGITPPLVSALFPPDNFADTVSFRAGAEWRHDVRGGCQTLALRAGYGFEPSPVPAQTGLPSLADNDRHIASLGAGWTTGAGRFLRGPVTFEAALSGHFLRGRDTVKNQALFPGRGFSSGGTIIGGTVSAKVQF